MLMSIPTDLVQAFAVENAQRALNSRNDISTGLALATCSKHEYAVSNPFVDLIGDETVDPNQFYSPSLLTEWLLQAEQVLCSEFYLIPSGQRTIILSSDQDEVCLALTEAEPGINETDYPTICFTVGKGE